MARVQRVAVKKEKARKAPRAQAKKSAGPVQLAAQEGVLQPPTAKPVPIVHRLSDAQLLEVYRHMLRLRTLDERMITLQRQGRVGFYGSCTGQEAATIASGYALEAKDWIFPGLREVGIMLMRGFPLVPYLGQVFGNKADVTKGRQMPSHQAARSVNYVSWGSNIGTQIPQAVGAAWAARYQGDDVVIAAYFGDGSTSTGDFHVAMNFAGVTRPPVVFLCQNNHWAISVPRKRQTASVSIAAKAQAYGFEGVQVDGNDVEAVYSVVKAAVEKARKGLGPTLVELETYRVGAHSTSDDPTKYRDNREVEVWKARDPLERCRKTLVARRLWDDAKDAALRAELLAEVNQAIQEAEAFGQPELDTLFDDVYAIEPWNLKEERAELFAAPRAPKSAGGGH